MITNQLTDSSNTHSLANVPISISKGSSASTPSIVRGVMVSNFDDLPDEMRGAKRWLLYKEEPNQDSNKKPRKVPYYVTGIKRHGVLDTPADQEKFTSFEEALHVLNKGGYAGMGFALGPVGGTENCWQGIDIDGISDHPELSDVVSDLPGYTEKSPSGNGMHAIGYGRKFETLGSNSTGIEAYSSGRFFTVTADYSGMYPPSCLAAFVENRLASMHRSKAKSTETYDDSICESITSGQITDLLSALFHLRADDRELWVQIGHALKGLGDTGRGLFMNWSYQSDKYDLKDAASTWESFKPTRTSYKAIFKIAQEAGWLNPASNAAQVNFKGHSSNSHNKCDTEYDLDTFALNGQSADLEKQLLDDKFILGRIAILGQVTVIYAPPNTGKTLLMLAMLRQGIRSGEVEAANVYFVNADDHFKGAVQKLKLAEESGFKMLVPSYNGFKAEMMEAILREQCLMGKARGMVLILDTMKKFTDLMSKSKGTDFMKAVREFVSHGGSIILLAHTNKHRNEAGGLIFAGTADVVDDCDCAYTLDTVTSNTDAGVESVKFENFKARGDNAIEEVYQYDDISDGMSYVAKLESVQLLSKEEKQLALKRKAVDGLLARNADAIKVIERLIRSGTTQKTEIIKAAGDDGISKAKAIKVLREHEGANFIVGQRWTVTILEKNSHVYKLNLIA